MKGLEVSIVKYSKIIVENTEFRIDSDYFKKEYLSKLTLIEKNGFETISNFADVTDGIHTSIDYSIDSNINLISATSPRENFFNLTRSAYISEKAHKANPRTALREKDVIISTVGTIGNCAVVEKEILPANSDRHVGIIRIKNSISPYFLSTFLVSKFGRFQTLRESTGNVQLNLFIYKIRTLKLPTVSNNFQLLIEKIVKNAHEYLLKSQSLYSQAENLLISELELKNWQPTKENSNSVSFSNSYLQSGRLDAEYYQPKYEEIENKIKKYHGGFCNLGETIKYIFTGEYSEEYMPKSDNYKFYIRSLNIKRGQVEIDNDYFVKPQNFNKKASKGDIITARVGTIGNFGEIEENNHNSICSDNVLCFRLPDNFMSDVYTLYFNTKFNFELVDRLARGSVQQRLNQETLKELIIPIIDKNIQVQVSEKVQQSFKLKNESKQLLELAKRAVEIAIEEGEEKGIFEIYKTVIETLKPNIIVNLSIAKELPTEIFDGVVSEFNAGGIITIPSKRKTLIYANSMEWSIPTAVIVGFILKSYADGFLSEAGKDHYLLLKSGLKKLLHIIKPLKTIKYSTKQLETKNTQSDIFSLETATKEGKHIKFLFNKDVSLEEWEAYIDTAIDLMIEHIDNEKNELQKEIDKLGKLKSSTIFMICNKQSNKWEAFDERQYLKLKFK